MLSLNIDRDFGRTTGLAWLVCLITWFSTASTLVAQDEAESNPPSTEQESEKDADAAEAAKPTEQQPNDETKNQKAESTEEKKPEPFTVKVAKETIEFTASGTWKQVTPKSGMIEAEIKLAKLGDDTEDGRLTIMGAGGTIEANITRWQGQFVEEDGEAVEAKTEVKTIREHEVHFVDISGTYLDMPGGPFAGGKAIERENYRMLAAIVETKDHGNYFVKLYGPQHTIEQNKAHFESMIESLKVAPAGSDSDSDSEPDSDSDSDIDSDKSI